MASLKTPIQPILRTQRLRLTAVRLPFASPARQYHTTGRLASYKDDQDRESLKPRSSEGTVTGSTNEVAEKDAAYNPKKTDPLDEKDAAAKESNGNPLEGSGANREFSRPKNPEETSVKSDRAARSAGGPKKKQGKVSPM